MITAKTVLDYGSYTIDHYIYSADVSETGKELITYEVSNEDMTVFEAFDTLEEAVDFVENQIAWEKLVNSLPSHPQITIV